MSRMGINIITRMQMRGASRSKSEAQSVTKEYKEVQGLMDDIDGKRPQIRNMSMDLLNAVSVAQLLRFSIKDVQDLAEGKDFFGNLLSLMTSLILLQFRLGQLMDANIAKATVLAAATATGLSPMGLAAIGLTVVGGGIVVGLGLQQQQRMAEIEADRALREQMAQTLGLIQQQENLTQTMTTATRQSLIDTRSTGNK